MRWNAYALGVGAVAIVVSWYVCAGDVTFSQQVGPIDAAVAGLLVAGLGNATWLLRGRRALGERRRALLPDVVAPAHRVSTPHVGWSDPAATTRGDSASTNANEVFLAGQGMERFHRPVCALAEGRSGLDHHGPRQEHLAAGQKPCGVCRP